MHYKVVFALQTVVAAWAKFDRQLQRRQVRL